MISVHLQFNLDLKSLGHILFPRLCGYTCQNQLQTPHHMTLNFDLEGQGHIAAIAVYF